MRKVTVLMFSAVAFATALFSDDAAELKILQEELSQIQATERAIEDAVKEDNPVDAMLKLIRDESLVRLYEKYSDEKWAVFASSIEKEISTANRRYKIPKATPGAAEEMLAILEPNLKELKKKYLAMSKGDPGWENLTRQMVEQKKKVDEFKKQAEEEKAAEKEKIGNAVSARNEAFLKISEKIKDKLQSSVEVSLERKITTLKTKIATDERAKMMAEKARVEASIRKAKAAEAARFKEEQKRLEPIYQKKKAWYEYQLDYNGFRECNFDYRAGTWGHSLYLGLYDPSDELLSIKANWTDDGDGVQLSWPQSLAKGLARDLLMARFTMHKYEHPNWEQIATNPKLHPLKIITTKRDGTKEEHTIYPE